MTNIKQHKRRLTDWLTWARASVCLAQYNPDRRWNFAHSIQNYPSSVSANLAEMLNSLSKPADKLREMSHRINLPGQWRYPRTLLRASWALNKLCMLYSERRSLSIFSRFNLAFPFYSTSIVYNSMTCRNFISLRDRNLQPIYRNVNLCRITSVQTAEKVELSHKMVKTTWLILCRNLLFLLPSSVGID